MTVLSKSAAYKRVLILLAVVLLCLLADRFVFMSSAVKVDMSPPVLHASSVSELKISVFPVNLLGFKTPFGESQVRFEIEQGANLIEVSEISTGLALVRSKGLEGEATVSIYGLKSGVLVQRLLIKILPKDLT
jgi:hypothetical protein